MHHNWDYVMKSSHICGQHLLSCPPDLQAQWVILLSILHCLTEKNRPDSILNPFSYNPCVLYSVLSHDPMDCSTPGFPVLHYLPEFAQAHVHWIGDTIQLSHPLPPFSPFAFNFSQPQGLISNELALYIRWTNFQLQYQSFQWEFSVDFL